MKQFFTLLVLLLTLSATAFAQRGTVSGTITDAGSAEPLVRASVFQEGVANGVFSDAKGMYSISLPAGEQTLTVSYLGYRTVSMKVTVNAGQDSKMDLALEATSLQGDEVVVSASRRAEKMTNAPATISIINAQAFNELPSFNGAELLARQRGVDYVRSGVLGVGVNMRGFNSAFNPKNLQINDGRLSTLVATGLPLGALSTTVKEDVERVEVVLGPSSALYGPNAHNGLLNTITKDPRTYQGTTVALGAGNQSVLTGRIRHATKVNDKLAFKISGEYTQGEEFDFTDTVYSVAGGVEFAKYPEYLLNRKFNSLRGEAQVYYSVGKKSDIIVGYGGSKSNNIGNTNAGRNQIRDWLVQWGQIRFVSPRLYVNLYNTWSSTDSTYAMNRRTLNYWSYKNAKNADGTAKFDEATARAKSIGTFWFPNAAFPNGGIELARGALFQDKSQRLNGEVQYNNSAGKLFNYIVGVQMQRDVANSNNTYLIDKEGEIIINQYGGYAQLERRFGNLRTVLAARADNHDLYGFNFIPKAALVYTIGDNGAARITYGRGISAPTILNLSANIFGGLLLGNGEGFTVKEVDVVTQTVVNTYDVRKLEVERIQTFEVGYKGLIGKKLFFDANAYYNLSENFLSPSVNIAPDRDFFDHDNNPATAAIPRIVGYATQRGSENIGNFTAVTPLIATQPTGEQGANTLLTYVNFGNVNTYGFDASLSYAFTSALRATLNYSWFGYEIDKTDLNNDGNRDGRVDVNDLPINTPANKLSLGVNYSSKKFFGSVFTRWVESYDFFSGINVAAKTNESLIYGGNPVIEGKRVGTSFNNGPLGGFVNVDLSLGYRFGKYLTLSGQVTNLFDSEVREFVASPVISRLFAVEAKIDLPGIK
ncbi:MAG: TonB-dependent receptor [Chitinophagales bacterium]|nr:TonB-dependent receptor [Chitinophagales bacterium]